MSAKKLELRRSPKKAAAVSRSKSRRPPIPIGEIRGKIDIGVMAIRPDEFKAVLCRFSKRRLVTGGRQLYDFTTVLDKSKRKVSIAFVRCPRQGQGIAQTVTFDMIADLNPRWLFLVGIGGGLPDDEFSLGDVVLANHVYDFSVSAARQSRQPEFSGDGGTMHREVLSLLGHIPALEDRLANWNSNRSIRAERPIVKPPATISDRKLYGSETWREDVQSSLQANFPPGKKSRRPKVRVAPMISTNALIKNADLAALWKSTARHTEAVEMELGGVYRAVHHSGRGARILAIRGLSDIVGYKRSGAWTEYACHTAGAFAHAMITAGVLSLKRRRETLGPAQFFPAPIKMDELDDYYQLIHSVLGDEIPSLELMRSWYQKSPDIYFALWSKRHGKVMTKKLIGFFAVLPLTQAAKRLFLQNKLIGPQLTPNHLVASRDTAAAYYIGGVGALSGPAQQRTFESLLSYLQGVIKGKTVFTRPITDDGLRKVIEYGFVPVPKKYNTPLQTVFVRDFAANPYIS